MCKFATWLAFMFFAISTLGCGDRGNQVVERPATDEAAQQQVYDDYDKQQTGASSDYK